VKFCCSFEFLDNPTNEMALGTKWVGLVLFIVANGGDPFAFTLIC
jgi:hypothetical protein